MEDRATSLPAMNMQHKSTIYQGLHVVYEEPAIILEILFEVHLCMIHERRLVSSIERVNRLVLDLASDWWHLSCLEQRETYLADSWAA